MMRANSNRSKATERTLAYLKQAYGSCATDLIWIGVKPVFGAIRSEPAFADPSPQLFSPT